MEVETSLEQNAGRAQRTHESYDELNNKQMAFDRPSAGPSGARERPFRIEARDLILRNFTATERPAPSTLLQPGADSKSQDFVSSYLSTPQFIMALTNLSDAVMEQPTNKDKLRFTKMELCKLNRRLPAQVYLPFVSKSMRNYAVLNVVAEDAIVFKTKERAPLLLTFEVYRPTEMLIDEPTELLNDQNF